MKQPYITLIKSLVRKAWPGMKAKKMEMRGCLWGATLINDWQCLWMDQDNPQRHRSEGTGWLQCEHWSNVVKELFLVKRWGSQLVREAEASFPHEVPFMLNRCSDLAPFYLSHFLNTQLRNVNISRPPRLSYRDIFFCSHVSRVSISLI